MIVVGSRCEACGTEYSVAVPAVATLAHRRELDAGVARAAADHDRTCWRRAVRFVEEIALR
jgi:hypothetical protein